MMKSFKSYFKPARDLAPEPQGRSVSRQRACGRQLGAAEHNRSSRVCHPPASDHNNGNSSTVTPLQSTPSNAHGRTRSHGSTSLSFPGPSQPGGSSSNSPDKTQSQDFAPRPNSSGLSRPGSQRTSSRQSVLPPHNNSTGYLVDIRNDMMVKWLYEQQLRNQYASGWDPSEGVVLKKERGSFTCCPPQLQSIYDGLFAMTVLMNVKCCMTVNTLVVWAILDYLINQGVDFVPLPDGLRVQILPTMTDLPKAQLHQFAAFIKDLRILIVWDDDPERILQRAADLEQSFMEMIWGGAPTLEGNNADEKKAVESIEEADARELEEAMVGERRPVRLENPCLIALTLAVCISCLGFGWRNLAMQIMVDGDYSRLGLVAATPVQFFVSLFFFQALVGNFFQILGPIHAVSCNSKYYSGKPPRRLPRTRRGFPHVTIQMPVYKEGLDAVIRPTIMSLKKAMSTFEMQGGAANIFVNDDGMQLISEEDAQARRDFYDEHNIGWVARPKHNPGGADGEKAFRRRGKFKKASNMNYALHVSNRVEERLQQVGRTAAWTQEDEHNAYHGCLSEVLWEDEGRTWAEGNIRVGDYILLIDSDTRVPADCLLDAVSEMKQSPNVALLQYSSGVMNVTHSYFENGVTWFTNLIYTAITFAVASGDASPFVGHNAVLRWQAIQDAAAYTDEDGYEKYWSESRVSEDFDMSLRLQVAGYALRYASYMGEGFKEGVSLTVYDELARWEKYAYGCNELLFHPLRFWITRGPFTRLFRDFLWSPIHLPKKLTIIAYIGTYYAIAAAWLLSLGNYLITGWYHDMVDKYYLDSFAIYISIIVVFTALGNVALAVLRYRLYGVSLLGCLFENLKWVPMFTIFLGGISIHLSQAILSHFLEIDMVWGATAKEVERVVFGEEILRILRRFKWTFAFCFLCTGLLVAGCSFFPFNWRIQTFYSIYPVASMVIAHFLMPVLLNPALMMFTW